MCCMYQPTNLPIESSLLPSKTKGQGRGIVLLQINQIFCPESGFMLEKGQEGTEAIEAMENLALLIMEALKTKGKGECVPK